MCPKPGQGRGLVPLVSAPLRLTSDSSDWRLGSPRGVSAHLCGLGFLTAWRPREVWTSLKSELKAQ